MRRAVNTISPAVMEYARATGLLAKWQPDRVIKTLSILPEVVQVLQKLLYYKEKTSLDVGVRVGWRRLQFVVDLHVSYRWFLLLQTRYNVP